MLVKVQEEVEEHCKSTENHMKKVEQEQVSLEEESVNTTGSDLIRKISFNLY